MKLSRELGALDVFALASGSMTSSGLFILHGLAISHIIISGQKQFKIVLVRNKIGIHFPNTDTLIKTVFILLGTKDERNFHLRALMAIAQIAQNSNLEKHWLEARNIGELRRLILLSNRTRD